MYSVLELHVHSSRRQLEQLKCFDVVSTYTHCVEAIQRYR
jgi:hypothetical protein